MFIHANIAHIAFNLFALAYLGGYAERAIGVARYVLVYLISGIVGSFISWYYSVLHLTQWRCSTNRCVRSYLWCIRYSSCSWQLQGLLLAGDTNCICSDWFCKCSSNSIFCSCWWIYCRCINDQGISKVRADKKKKKIFSAVLIEKRWWCLPLSIRG